MTYCTGSTDPNIQNTPLNLQPDHRHALGFITDAVQDTTDITDKEQNITDYYTASSYNYDLQNL